MQFRFNVSVLGALISVHVLNCQLTAMHPEATDKGVDGVQLGVAKEAYPKSEIADDSLRGIQVRIHPFPQAAAPVGGLLLDVTVGAGQKAVPRPMWDVVNSDGHTFFVIPGRATRNPFHLWKVPEDAAHYEEASGVQHVAGVEPAHDFSGGPSKPGVQGVIQPVIGLADPPRNV